MRDPTILLSQHPISTALAHPSRRPQSVSHRPSRAALIVEAVLLTLSLHGWMAQGQENPKIVDTLNAEDALTSSLGSEKNQGAYTFYREAYTDTDSKKAVYSGSIYGAITAFKVDGCMLDLEVAIVDRFSGAVDNRPTGEQQDSTRYSVTVPLNEEIAANLAVHDARPLELGPTTHALCMERPACTFTWLDLHEKNGDIKESKIVNDLLVFRGTTTRFLVPLSSAISGDRIAQALRTFVREKCR